MWTWLARWLLWLDVYLGFIVGDDWHRCSKLFLFGCLLGGVFVTCLFSMYVWLFVVGFNWVCGWLVWWFTAADLIFVCNLRVCLLMLGGYLHWCDLRALVDSLFAYICCLCGCKVRWGLELVCVIHCSSWLLCCWVIGCFNFRLIWFSCLFVFMLVVLLACTLVWLLIDGCVLLCACVWRLLWFGILWLLCFALFAFVCQFDSRCCLRVHYNGCFGLWILQFDFKFVDLLYVKCLLLEWLLTYLCVVCVCVQVCLCLMVLVCFWWICDFVGWDRWV